MKCGLARIALILFAIFCSFTSSHAQGFDRIERGRSQDMLKNIKNEMKKNYYDSTFHGLDLDAIFKKASDKLDNATSLGQAFGIIAQAVIDLNDSHTRFYPPKTTAKVQYPWLMQMIGNRCYITSVKPGSEAEKQGLKAGDEVLAVESFHPNRREMWKILYYYNILSPRSTLRLQIRSPDSSEARDIDIKSKVTTGKRISTISDVIYEYENSSDEVKHRFLRLGSTIIWQMPSFITSPESIDSIMKDRVRDSSNLVLDLRGNSGGYVVTLERLAGYFVENDTKIADLKGRKEMKPQLAKTRGGDVFHGKLVILIDANSASASEIFARFMQLQQRAVVIGDQSAGAVMQSQGVSMSRGVDSVVFYGMSLTNADVIMSDGVSLEHIGVQPQIEILPTASDLAAGRDPVISAAIKLLGQEFSPLEAGKLFPYEWKDN